MTMTPEELHREICASLDREDAFYRDIVARGGNPCEPARPSHDDVCDDRENDGAGECVNCGWWMGDDDD